MNKQQSSPENFYNNVASIYEKMIDFPKNLELRISAYKEVFPTTGITADIGGGTGLDSIALALNGHQVTMFDISEEMVNEAQQNARKYNVNIETEVQSFSTIPKNYFNEFNNVVSVGNTIAHLTVSQLYEAVNKIYRMLLPGGKVFLHILNYDSIIKQAKRINNIANRDGQIIIRFYDFREGHLLFNILSFPINDAKNYNLITTKHFPHSETTIRKILKETGFKNYKFYCDFNLHSFNKKTSKDIFITASK